MINEMKLSETASSSEMITISRTGNPPLRFKGRQQIGRHYASDLLSARFALWECTTGGYVPHLELTDGDRRQSYAQRVETQNDALAFLEALQTGLKIGGETPPAGSRRPQTIDRAARSLLRRSRNKSAQTMFQQLIGDFSALTSAETT